MRILSLHNTEKSEKCQLFYVFGYKHIYLLGIDHNFDKITTENGEVVIDPSVKNYFIEGYDDDVTKEVHHNLGNTTRAYYDVRRFVDKTVTRLIYS